MINRYLEELYNLYVGYPYLSYEKLSEYLNNKYNIHISQFKIREYLREKYPNISKDKTLSKKNGVYFTNNQLNILYKLYTEPPFLTYEQLTNYVKRKFQLNVNSTLIRAYLTNNFRDISKIKSKNRVYFKGKWSKTFSESQLNELYHLYTKEPYYSYKQLVKFAEETYNIKVNISKIRDEIIFRFPYANAKRQAKKNDIYMHKDGKTISASDKKVIIELIIEGYTQREIAQLTNVSQSYISRIIKKSKVEIDDLKFNRIVLKLGNIPITYVKDIWEKTMTVSSVRNKLKKLGSDITNEEIKYLLKYKLNCKKRCKLCGKKVSLNKAGLYCSTECKKEARKDSIRKQQINRRVKGNGKTTQSVSRLKKINEAHGICYLCGEKLNTEIRDQYHPLYIVLDHVNPLIYSNNSSEENLKAVCRCCNNLKSDKPADYYSKEEYVKNKIKKIKLYKSKGNKLLIDREEFKNDCINGMSIKSLCEKYNRSNHIIYKIKKELGLLKQEKKHIKLDVEQTINQVANLTKEGYTISYIANILNIADVTVSKYRKLSVEKGLLEKGKIYYTKGKNGN